MWHLLAQDVNGFWLVKLLCQGVCKNGAESIIVGKKTQLICLWMLKKVPCVFA